MYFTCANKMVSQGLYTPEAVWKVSMDNLLLLCVAVTLGHHWNPFVVVDNQSSQQLHASAKKQSANLSEVPSSLLGMRI